MVWERLCGIDQKVRPIVLCGALTNGPRWCNLTNNETGYGMLIAQKHLGMRCRDGVRKRR